MAKFKISSEFRIALIYTAIGALWISFSDKILHTLVTDAEQAKTIEVFKGFVYVAITGFLLYVLIRKEFKRRNKILLELNEAKLKAEESDRLKTAFLANMSHYLRTPMNSILGFVDILKRRNLDDEKREKFLTIINEQSNHLLQFIDNIIEISKLQEGQTKVNIEEFSLNNLIRKIQLRYQTEIDHLEKGKKIKLTGSVLNEDMIMHNDSEKIEYIFTNLLSNSIKFTKQGEINFGYTVKNGWINFFVFDTGIGIPAEKQELITKTFMLSEPELNQENIGIGLGLAITKGLVKLLNGKLWLESSNNKGSKFCFSVPANYDS